MGLRINTNIAAVRSLRNLRVSDRIQSKSLERLATGLRINRASDDPAGLVISEQLRAQIRSLEQAVENSQNGINLISTAEAALVEIGNRLRDILDSCIFASDGTASDNQVTAEQDAVDSAIDAIDRIAATARFDSIDLLNGNSGYRITEQSNELNDIYVRGVNFNGLSSRTFSVVLDQVASQARTAIGAVAGGDVTIRISGNRGTQNVLLNSGSTVSQVRSAINLVAGMTGVWASGTDAISESYGSDAVVSITVLEEGTESGATMGGFGAGTILSDTGSDAVGTINNFAFSAIGRDVSMVTRDINISFEFEPTAAVNSGGTAYEFKVVDSGLRFQINTEARPTDQVNMGIRSVHTSFLGYESVDNDIANAIAGTSGNTVGGYLSSLKSGGENCLRNDPENAVRIVNSAIEQVSSLRGFLGAVQADTLESNIDSLDVAIENLVSSESMIRDLDFAAETSEFTRSQILFQAGTATLASANLIPQTVLTLLQ